ncbi:MAG: hypothetical protein JNG89_07455, partial [Planctomycetaceae bacterium]|nr:hypothetical protein [Planctomycetaceae bacterium]
MAVSGCANLLTSRAIDEFSRSLAEGNTEELRELTSERFAHQALRLPEAGDDFKVLNLPKGKLTVLQTKDLAEDKKHLTVQVGDSDEKNETLEFHLVRPPGERRWVVDDVFVTQSKGEGANPVTKSVTEQMDLLLTVREFLGAWSSGSREDVLAITADELRTALDGLPPTYLQQVASQTVVDVNRKTLRPEAHIDDDIAVVKLSRSRNGLMISLARKEQRWLVTDVRSESRDGGPVTSVSEMASTLQTAVSFLNAYAANDRAAIATAADPAFDRKLAGADLTTIQLPVIAMLASQYEYLPHGDSVDLVMPHNGSKYVVSLLKQTSDKPKGLNKSATYLVSEVTIYENNSSAAKRLSALFTVNAVVEVFAKALIARDRS